MISRVEILNFFERKFKMEMLFDQSSVDVNEKKNRINSAVQILFFRGWIFSKASD